MTVVEVLVALIVFSIAALGSAATLGHASRQHAAAAARREATGVLRTYAAVLSALTCDDVASGGALTNGVPVTWTVTRDDSVAQVTLTAAYRGTVTTLRTEVLCN